MVENFGKKISEEFNPQLFTIISISKISSAILFPKIVVH